jgi:hypothetical protein
MLKYLKSKRCSQISAYDKRPASNKHSSLTWQSLNNDDVGKHVLLDWHPLFDGFSLPWIKKWNESKSSRYLICFFIADAAAK